jgi:hypothetical protein
MTLVVSLLLAVACSGQTQRTGYLEFPEDSLSGGVEEEPTLVLRCLNGRVDAYLAMDPSADPGVADQIVPVQLDSAPPCSGPVSLR